MRFDKEMKIEQWIKSRKRMWLLKSHKEFSKHKIMFLKIKKMIKENLIYEPTKE